MNNTVLPHMARINEYILSNMKHTESMVFHHMRLCIQP